MKRLKQIIFGVVFLAQTGLLFDRELQLEDSRNLTQAQARIIDEAHDVMLKASFALKTCIDQLQATPQPTSLKFTK